MTDFVGVLAERIDTLTWRVLIFACDGLELIVGLGSSLEFVFWDCLCARVWWIGSCGDLGAWVGLGRLMDRVLLCLLVMRWKSWYLEHGVYRGRGATSSKVRGREEANLDLGQLVILVALRLDVRYTVLERSR